MQNFRNYYEILGVSRDTPSDEIKRVYRQLARRYHPDVNQGDIDAENRFKEINEAYEVLFDSERRAQYDKYGSFWKQQGFQNGQKRPWGWNGKPDAPATPPVDEPDLNFGEFRDFNTFVDELLQGRSKAAKPAADWLDNPIPPRRNNPPPNQMPSMSSRPIEENRYEPKSDDWENTQPKPRRDSWGGSEPIGNTSADPRRQEFTARPRPPEDREPDRQPQREPQRQPGSREAQRRDAERPDFNEGPRPTSDDRYTQQQPKPFPKDVEAELTVPLEKAYAGGQERIRLEDGRMLEIKLPKATVGGQKLRLKGQGIAGGDLFLRIDVAPHKFYQLNGLNVMTQVPVTPAEAVLAGPIDVPTLDGLVKMNLPVGLKSGQKLRLSNKGYPSAEGDRRGDQIVELVIQMPGAELPEAEKALYEQIRQVEKNPRSNLV
jgi:curved DNA-binding protein